MNKEKRKVLDADKLRKQSGLPHLDEGEAKEMICSIRAIVKVLMAIEHEYLLNHANESNLKEAA